MSEQSLDVSPGPTATTVRTADGQVLDVPPGWALLPPGDAGLTRRVKRAGPAWTVREKRGRKSFSRGVWAPREHIEQAQGDLDRERATPSYQRKLAAARARRASAEVEYAEEFREAVFDFLDFHHRHAELGVALATAIAQHATPVGSGTVARTKRIPVERRAEAATIAWLRHQTTAYDSMSIPRIKGMRREVRRLLAERARALLTRYRRGEAVAPVECLLRRGLQRASSTPGSSSDS